MTTYGFKLSLDEQEFSSIKEAIDFYLTSEAEELRKTHPHLVKYAAEIRLKEMLSSGKLYESMEMLSRNNFREVATKKINDL
jgi:hypothetical protein